jgi:beta-lactam-binding protein with PASTA domain
MKRLSRTILCTTLVVALLGSGLTSASAEEATATTEVPTLIGKLEADALALLADRGLKAEIIHVADDVAPAGTVIGQDPKSGSELLVGSKITLRVIQHAAGDGDAPMGDAPIGDVPGDLGIPMPDLLGRTMQGAEQTLIELGLVPRFLLIEAADRSPYTVIAQDRLPNAMLALGDEVRLEIAKPLSAPALVRVPHLMGLAEADAMQLLHEMGFDAHVMRQISSWPQGRVFAQTPAAGAEVAPGTHIDIRVALQAPTPVKVQVPSLVGMSSGQARLALLARGLTYGQSQGLKPGANINRVYAQNRIAGSLVMPGTKVIFKLPLRAKVPVVVGLTKNAAKQKLQNAGFQAQLVGPAVGAGTTKVVSQDKPANQWIAKGSLVRATYVFEPLILVVKKPVPNVVGLSINQAKAKIQALGFQSFVYGPANGFGVKVIKSQTPAAGTMLLVGKTVKAKYGFKPIVINPNPLPQPLLVEVPLVKGKTLPAAKAALQAKGLKWSVIGAFGIKVKKQSKAAGTKVLKGTTIILTRGM